jgi:hypothetical protein
VAEQQLVRTMAWTFLGHRHEHPAALFARENERSETPLGKRIRQDAHHMYQGLSVSRGRLAEDQSLEKLGHALAISIEVVEDPLGKVLGHRQCLSA